ncbi:IS66 family transposase (plasmid) [Cupriavidus sp. KK10]|jgi:transposase|uniref:IS66 family transposase n=1 Tax=Cupriavidus sp. KK10 TaxID=1478019 RepID=UPI001BA72DFA|nr:IS66 family transposase [Cupriavidus sp. KK10]QUN32171.1 IS66 family transposase [Cupriavidus sp. KK10]
MIDTAQLQGMNADQLRALAMDLMSEVRARDSELRLKDTRIAQLTHEMAVLKRWKFAARSEKLPTEQQSLLDEAIDADLIAIEHELEQLASKPKNEPPPNKPRRAPLPPNLPRVEVRHEPTSTTCGCGCQLKRIGEDVSEKLDYTPGVFTVERHVRGKWVCAQCETLTQAPVPAQVIDKGIPTAGLLAQVLVAKYSDHLPLYRQERIFERAGLAIPRSTLAQWVGMCGVQLQPLVDALKEQILQHRVLHADETPVAMLSPGKGKTQRAYLWTYCPGAFEGLRAVVYDFADSRAGEHARNFLGNWKGQLVCDDFTGYKALFAQGITELGCMAHARRKFYDLHAASKSQIAQDALQYIGELYEIEREVQQLAAQLRLEIRQQRARPIADALYAWMTGQRARVSEGSAIAKALDYSLRRWTALTRYLKDPQVPIDNNWCENQIRPVALGRSNWLFAGSLRAGRRAAAAMSLLQSARLNGHDPYADLKDVLTRLPTQPASRLEELLPHHWQLPQS